MRAYFLSILAVFLVSLEAWSQDIDMLGIEDGRIVFFDLGLLGEDGDGTIFFVADSQIENKRTCFIVELNNIPSKILIKNSYDCGYETSENQEDPSYNFSYNQLSEIQKNLSESIPYELKVLKYQVIELKNYEIGKCVLNFSWVADAGFGDFKQNIISYDTSDYAVIIKKDNENILLYQSFLLENGLLSTKYHINIC